MITHTTDCSNHWVRVWQTLSIFQTTSKHCSDEVKHMLLCGIWKKLKRILPELWNLIPASSQLWKKSCQVLSRGLNRRNKQRRLCSRECSADLGQSMHNKLYDHSLKVRNLKVFQSAWLFKAALSCWFHSHRFGGLV